MDTKKFMLLRGARILKQLHEHDCGCEDHLFEAPELDNNDEEWIRKQKERLAAAEQKKKARQGEVDQDQEQEQDQRYRDTSEAPRIVPKNFSQDPPPKDGGSTYADLERNVMNFQPRTKKRQYALAPLQIQGMEFSPLPNANNLMIEASVSNPESETKANAVYNPKMLFSGVEFHTPESEEEVANPNTVTMDGKNGKEFTMTPISLSKSNVKVQCNCLDFWWRFSFYNHKDSSLMGYDVGFYRKKTNRPPVNPRQVPAMCKHLLKLAIELKNNGIVS